MSDFDITIPEFLYDAPPRVEVTLDEARTRTLVPGDVVTPIPHESDIDSLESVLVHQVYPGDEKFERVQIPLSREIHPNRVKNVNFRGKLLNGFAVIQETDPALLAAHTKGRVLDSDQALTAIVGAEMHSTGRGTVGIVLREVIYFLRARVENGEHVGRYILPTRVFGDDGHEAFVKMMDDSTTRASKQAAWALRHVLLGGGFESKRYNGKASRSQKFHP